MLIPAKSCLKQTYNYTKGNKNLYIEEQTTQWPKEKVQKDKQRSTKHTITGNVLISTCVPSKLVTAEYNFY
jgi:hypothetical protein